MRPTTSLLLRLVCSLALLFSALPTRAGVVCVESGRVVGLCFMASIPERAIERPKPKEAAMARMACCRPRVATQRSGVAAPDLCPTHPKTRRAYAYRSDLPLVSGAEHPRLEIPRLALVAALPPSFALPPFDLLAGPRGAAFSGDSDPPRCRPSSPDRARAPPVL